MNGNLKLKQIGLLFKFPKSKAFETIFSIVEEQIQMVDAFEFEFESMEIDFSQFESKFANSTIPTASFGLFWWIVGIGAAHKSEIWI